MKLLLHPLPVRIFHWTMFISVVVLLATGLYIHEPPSWLALPVGLARKLHGVFAMMVMANLFGQIYYYLVTTKFTEVLFLPRDWSNILLLCSFLVLYRFICTWFSPKSRLSCRQCLQAGSKRRSR